MIWITSILRLLVSRRLWLILSGIAGGITLVYVVTHWEFVKEKINEIEQPKPGGIPITTWLLLGAAVALVPPVVNLAREYLRSREIEARARSRPTGALFGEDPAPKVHQTGWRL